MRRFSGTQVLRARSSGTLAFRTRANTTCSPATNPQHARPAGWMHVRWDDARRKHQLRGHHLQPEIPTSGPELHICKCGLICHMRCIAVQPPLKHVIPGSRDACMALLPRHACRPNAPTPPPCGPTSPGVWIHFRSPSIEEGPPPATLTAQGFPSSTLVPPRCL